MGKRVSFLAGESPELFQTVHWWMPREKKKCPKEIAYFQTGAHKPHQKGLNNIKVCLLAL